MTWGSSKLGILGLNVINGLATLFSEFTLCTAPITELLFVLIYMCMYLLLRGMLLWGLYDVSVFYFYFKFLADLISAAGFTVAGLILLLLT